MLQYKRTSLCGQLVWKRSLRKRGGEGRVDHVKNKNTTMNINRLVTKIAGLKTEVTTKWSDRKTGSYTVCLHLDASSHQNERGSLILNCTYRENYVSQYYRHIYRMTCHGR